MTARSLSRIAGAAGAAYVGLAAAGNSVGSTGASPDFTAPASEVARYLITHPPTAVDYAAGFVELVAVLCFVAFVAKLSAVLRRAEGGDGFLSTTVLGAGLLSAAIKLGSAPPMLVALNRAGEGIDPQVAAALVDMNSFAFMLTFALDALMLAAAAAVILTTGVLPRWLGVSAAVVAPLMLATVAGAGAVPPLAMLLTFAWLVSISVVLVRRAGRAEEARVAPQPSPTPA
jgi:hypothetical protein